MKDAIIGYLVFAAVSQSVFFALMWLAGAPTIMHLIALTGLIPMLFMRGWGDWWRGRPRWDDQ